MLSRHNTAITEIIAASGKEIPSSHSYGTSGESSRVPGPGPGPFTRSLIHALEELAPGPPFTAAMLHGEVLSHWLGRVDIGSGRRRSMPMPIHIVLSNGESSRNGSGVGVSIELTPLSDPTPTAPRFEDLPYSLMAGSSGLRFEFPGIAQILGMHVGEMEGGREGQGRSGVGGGRDMSRGMEEDEAGGGGVDDDEGEQSDDRADITKRGGKKEDSWGWC